MKKIAFVILLFAAFSAKAQMGSRFEEDRKIKEFGVQFNDLENFGLTLKKGNGKHFWRFGVLNLNSSQNTMIVNDDDVMTDDIKDKSKGIGLKFGFERRKSLTQDFETYWGVDLLYSYTKITDAMNEQGDTDRFRNINKGFGFVLGVNYHINSKFMVSAEIVPSYTWTRLKKKEADVYDGDYKTISKGVEFNFDNQTASLTFSYVF